MQLSNLSQVLLRNEQLLVTQRPLLINMPNDGLAHCIKEQNPDCQITYYDTNFEQHLYHQQANIGDAIFSAQYQTKLVHDLVIIAFPKSKKELQFTLAMLADCTNEDTCVLVVGDNKGGIKSIAKIVANQTSFCQKVDAARHCILFEAALNNHHQPFQLSDWYHHYQININEVEVKVAALPGVFSQEKLDVGTTILLENLPQNIQGKVLDFGCGAGVIASYVGIKHPKIELQLADVSALALASSEETLSLNHLKGKTIATNSLSHIKERYDGVLSNPPFHQGIKTHYLATETFLAGIKKQLNRGGMLTVVANSFLKYQPIMEANIGKTQKTCVKQGFTVYQVSNN